MSGDRQDRSLDAGTAAIAIQAIVWGGFLFLLGVAAWAQSDESPLGSDSRTCLMCHGENSPLPAAGIMHSSHASVFGDGGDGCAACHGPSRDHLSISEDGTRPSTDVAFGSDEAFEEANAACLGCHSGPVGMHWAGSAHEFEELACTDCHAVHDSQGDPSLDPARQSGVCFDCHQRERAEFMRPHRHPLGSTSFSSDADLLECTDCHDAHGSTTVASLKRMTLNETCYDCHAELRGPFLWEHAPVREDCSTCHLPHGAIHDALLRQRPPQLCQQCHLAQFHPSTVRSGRGLPPSGADPNLLGQSCMNCHTAVHGSNHPSSPGFTR